MTLYFAYGSNLNMSQMNSRCPGARLLAPAGLKGYRFVINRLGVATLIPDVAAEVMGMLWDLSRDDIDMLDRYEGCRQGLYDKCYRITYSEGVQNVPALVYIDHRNTALGSPRKGYLEGIIAGAERHDFPAEYIQMLRSWPQERDFRAFNRLLNDARTRKELPLTLQTHVLSATKALKERRDELILRALSTCAEADNSRSSFEDLLRNVVGNELKRVRAQLEVKEAARLAFELAGFQRFLDHIQTLEGEVKSSALLERREENGEVAGAGIIITSEADRVHADEDRLVVTSHSPLVAWLWKRVFEEGCGIHPRACAFIDGIAHLLEHTPCFTDDMSLSVLILAGVRGLATSRVETLMAEIGHLKGEMCVSHSDAH